MPPRSPASAKKTTKTTKTTKATKATKAKRHFAIIGAGMAGIACARTLVQAGHQVTVFEKAEQVGGRTATHDTPHGNFDAGTQYFTVRDDRFAQALATVPGVCRPWSANSVRVLDATGQVASPSQPPNEAHWVACPGMDALAKIWAQPLQQDGQLHTNAHVVCIERDRLQPSGWQLSVENAAGEQQVHAGFDAVLLTLPAPAARALLVSSDLHTPIIDTMGGATMAACWSLMLAFPQAVRPGLTLGPQWNAARSTHHRIAWLARESSKPQRNSLERWTVQASPAWSEEHLEDNPTRVQDKLLKAFADVTGIRATPGFVQVRRWRYAQTLQSLGQSHLWDADSNLGACGDWCLGHRLEDAFISGLEMALAVA